ncbi:MAG TPA: hypothetical protein VFV10_03735 [Gammaproteobacteria bacterium]|nr:hypothetical protein [Gammaproteobacteria bacterium]
MTMQAESLEVLENAAVPPAQARAIVRAIEIEIAGAKETLATKHDLVLLRQDLYKEIADLRVDVNGRIAELRTQVIAAISDLRGEMNSRLSDQRGEMNGKLSDLRGELRAEIHASASNVTRQMYAALLGQLVVLLGLAYFFATHVAR